MRYKRICPEIDRIRGGDGMIVSAPAAEGGQELNNDLRTSKFSKKPQKPEGINRLQVLNEIANKWASMGIYPSTNSALIALLEGLL